MWWWGFFVEALLNTGVFAVISTIFLFSLTRKKNAFLCVLASLFISVVSSFLCSLLIGELFKRGIINFENGTSPWITILFNFTLFFSSMAGVFLTFREKPSYLFFALIATMAGKMIFSTVYDFVLCLSGNLSVFLCGFWIAESMTFHSWVEFFAVLSSVWLILFFCFGLYFARAKKEFQKTLNGLILFLFSFILIFSLCYNVIATFDSFHSLSDSFYVFTMLSQVFISLLILVIERFLLVWVKDLEEKENTERFFEEYKRQSAITQQSMDLVNRKCHDMKYQIHSLLEGKVDRNYLEEMKQAIAIYDSRLKTGNEYLDVILMEKSLQCEMKGIDLTVMIDGKELDFLEHGDLNSIFGNLLDNAIKHLSAKEERENRFIRISSKEQKGMLLVRMENYCTAELRFDKDGLPVTTERDTDYHGYGVKSVKKTAEKYGGNTDFNLEENLFSVTLLFPKTSKMR